MGPIALDTAPDPLCPDFLQRGTSRGQLCAAFFTKSRMQFGEPIKLHRRSGQGGSRTWSPLHSGIYETSSTVERIASFKSNGPNSDKLLIPLTRRARS
jgi:hypothetical protein